MSYTLHHGDALDVLRGMEPGAADVLICDPPAGISFMNMAFDSDRGGRDQWVAWLAGILAEAYRILPAGACSFVWSLPRTSHWTAIACEDAGFRIVDRVAHAFGSGFPKNKHALKPAVEDWWLLQKPGAARRLNVDACRIGTGDDRTGGGLARVPSVFQVGRQETRPTAGRWPAHLILSHSAACNGVCAPSCPIRLLGEQSGQSKSSGGLTKTFAKNHRVYGMPSSDKLRKNAGGLGDTGTAARFFTNLPAALDDTPLMLYHPKASRRERNAGCEGLPIKKNDWQRETSGMNQDRPNREGRKPMEGASNHHPTVKNLALMTWLVRLISQPGSTVLDCFMGSGSTGVAALKEGRNFIGIEREAEYLEIARARLAHAAAEARQEVLL